MHQTDVFLTYDPNRLLDYLLHQMVLGSDKQLSRKLGVSHQMIRAMRAGRLAVGASMLLWMADCSGRDIEELRWVLGDRRSKLRVSCKTLPA